MEKAELVEDIGHPFLSEQAYMVQADDIDDGEQITAENTDDSNHDGGDKIGIPLREQDRFLPIANVAKIMKRAIPESGKIAKDARECVQECVSEFISFITSEASERCHLEKRKTINGEDILFAMSSLGFDHYVEPLKLYLQKYRDATKSDKNLHTNEVLYEELPDDNYNSSMSGNIISTETTTPDTVIFTYQPENVQQFQLNHI
ncbi:nuclear transcription factor Y subunit beta isoform X2 [Onthophagus taurus]|uniref:nuclear transcription factor Y subunit beta isoform X2 n=1 Tax=Onthophagus taurus TaxID=166361 RepID=UPI000C20DF42|nr:nuclear transcription factor Y subunit beta isoform X2 [Onthophagus taurus]